jgi:predicted O-methyltransferase YrrM
MDLSLWRKIDDFIGSAVVRQDEALDLALRHSAAAGLPAIQVGAPQGKLLGLLVRGLRARKVLEIGTLGGYGTIWLAKALPEDGTVITLEVDAGYAAVARENVAQAGLSGRVRVLQGEALTLLPALAAKYPEGFDFVFIDADKPNSLQYYEWAMRLSRPGSMIMVDNVVRHGAVVEAKRDASAEGIRLMLEAMGNDRRVSSTVIQTVGAKGYDGFALAFRMA